MKSLARSLTGIVAVLTLLVLGSSAAAEHVNPGDTQVISRPTGLDPLPAPTTNDSFLNSPFQGSIGPPGRTVSGDGNLIVFASDADGLSTLDNNRVRNVFVRNLTTHATTLVSVATDGTAANGDCYEPAISKDGTKVAFVTTAGNLGDGVTTPNSLGHTYVRDLSGNTTKLVSRASDSGITPGAPGNNGGDQPSISADGHLIAFASYTGFDSTNDTVAFSRDVYIRDMTAKTTTLVSRA